MSNRNREDVIAQEDEEWKNLRRTELILNFVNMVSFGSGMILLTFGILYLTVYKFEYSMTDLGPTLFSAFCVSFGAIQMIVAILCHFTLKSYVTPHWHLVYALYNLFMFMFFFIISLIALIRLSNGEFMNESRQDMFRFMSAFDEINTNSRSTRRVNWLHQRFHCCGVDAFTDWNAILRAGGRYMPVQFVGQYNHQRPYDMNVPFVDDIPDSCCVNYFHNCGNLN
jgi:hypothetical protein